MRYAYLIHEQMTSCTCRASLSDLYRENIVGEENRGKDKWKFNGILVDNFVFNSLVMSITNGNRVM